MVSAKCGDDFIGKLSKIFTFLLLTIANDWYIIE